MTLPSVVSTARLTLPLWEARDVAAIRGEIERNPAWHPEFPSSTDVDAAGLWHDGDAWGPRSIVRGTTTLGSIGFFGPPEQADDGTPEIEVGFGLVEAARGWGFAAEALLALVGVAESQGVRVRAAVVPGNVASMKVLTKAGLTRLRGADESGNLVMVRPMSAQPQALELEIRPTTAEDWSKLRALRLLHAREHPLSLGMDEEDARAVTEEQWRERAAAGNCAESGCLVAIDRASGRWIGVMEVLASDETGPTPVITRAFVVKQYRGAPHSVADQLIGPILAWAGRRSEIVRLWAYEGSETALKFFARHHFTASGQSTLISVDHPEEGSFIELGRRLR